MGSCRRVCCGTSPCPRGAVSPGSPVAGGAQAAGGAYRDEEDMSVIDEIERWKAARAGCPNG